MAIDISRACAIDGWCAAEELRWLAERAALSAKAIELGSWCGRSTRALADHVAGTLWAVDNWYGSPGAVDPVNDLLVLHGREMVMARFQQNLADVIATGKVIVVNAASHIAAAQLLAEHGPTFDLCFIDASHGYLSVKADLLAYRPLLRPGGTLCGHDIGFGGVRQAVDEVLGGYIPGAGTIWVAPGGQP